MNHSSQSTLRLCLGYPLLIFLIHTQTCSWERSMIRQIQVLHERFQQAGKIGCWMVLAWSNSRPESAISISCPWVELYLMVPNHIRWRMTFDDCFHRPQQFDLELKSASDVGQTMHCTAIETASDSWGSRIGTHPTQIFMTKGQSEPQGKWFKENRVPIASDRWGRVGLTCFFFHGRFFLSPGFTDFNTLNL